MMQQLTDVEVDAITWGAPLAAAGGLSAMTPLQRHAFRCHVKLGNALGSGPDGAVTHRDITATLRGDRGRIRYLAEPSAAEARSAARADHAQVETRSAPTSRPTNLAYLRGTPLYKSWEL